MLNSYFDRIKSTTSGLFNNVGRAIGGAFGGLTNLLTGGNAQAANAVYSIPKPNQTSAVQTPIPTSTNKTGNGVGNIIVPQVYGGANDNVIGTYSSSTPGDFNQSTGSYNLRPSTYTGSGGMTPMPAEGPKWTAPVDEYGRASSKQAGTPFVNANGVWVIPDQGFTGVTGTGGSGFTTANSAPMTGSQGLTGTDNARGYGGVGQGSAGNLYNQPTSDEEKKKADEKKGSTTIVNPQDQANKMAQDVAPFLAGNQPKIATPGLPDVFDAGFMQKATEEVAKLTSYTGADRNAIINSLMGELQNSYNQLTASAQDQGPVVMDTPAQLAWYEESMDPSEKLAKQQAVDEYTATKTNLNQLLSSKDLIDKQILATDEVFTNQVNAIKDNPNLPKALARRQVTDLLAVNERATKGLVLRSRDLAGQINTQQRVVDDAFQLKKDAEADMKYEEQQKQQALDRYLNNPQRIATLGTADLKALSEMSGMSVNALKNMGEKALLTKQEITQRVNPKTGALEGYDANTGSVVWSRPGFDFPGKAPGTGTGGEVIRSGGAVIPGSAIAEGEQKLLASRGSDNYVDPTVYLNMYQTWTGKGGLVSDFVKQYPPEDYVNPANTWLPKEIMPKEKVSNPFR